MSMEQRNLPDPTKLGFNGRSSWSLDSIMTRTSPLKIEPDLIRLPPILHSPFDSAPPSRSEMLRKPSTTSTPSYKHYPNYHTSRSTSPITTFLEPAYGHSPPVNRVAMTIGHFQPYPGPRLPIVQGQADTKANTAGKVARRKRKDRKHFSRLGNGTSKGEKASKEQGEAGRRYDHSWYLATIQNELLEINPSMPKVAARREGDNKTGWVELKTNNVSIDIEKEDGIKPLRYNKTDIFESCFQVIQQSTAIIEDGVQLLQALEAEAVALLQSKATPEELKRFLSHLVHSILASRIATASAHRGTVGFVLPSQFSPKPSGS